MNSENVPHGSHIFKSLLGLTYLRESFLANINNYGVTMATQDNFSVGDITASILQQTKFFSVISNPRLKLGEENKSSKLRQNCRR